MYYGSAGGLSGSPGWTAESNQEESYFGRSAATAGDVNGDGYADVVVGAYLYDNGQTDEGRAYLYYGAAGGLGGSPGWTAESNQAIAYFGNSVATAGDVNGDGYADVIVGAPLYDNGQTDEGMAFVYYGSANGLGPTPAWTAESNQANAEFGESVATAGDVNGDGYADVIVGAMWYANGQVHEGRAFVFYGSAGGLSGSPGWTVESNQEYACLGISVATAGDVNGDGYADVIVGASAYDNCQTDEGRAYVFYGSADGLGHDPAWTAERDQADAGFGNPVATAGDVNGDGYADVIVGAPRYDNGQTDEGRTFVYYGSAGGLSGSPGWTAESNQASAYFGWSVATAGDVNGDGYADVIAGALGYGNGQVRRGPGLRVLWCGRRTTRQPQLDCGERSGGRPVRPRGGNGGGRERRRLCRRDRRRVRFRQRSSRRGPDLRLSRCCDGAQHERGLDRRERPGERPLRRLGRGSGRCQR